MSRHSTDGSLLSRGVELVSSLVARYRTDGPSAAVRRACVFLLWNGWVRLYLRIRPLLPRRLSVFNGVLVRDLPPNRPRKAALVDYCRGLVTTALYQQPYRFQSYEAGLVQGIESYARRGDDVVIIGGGRGVTAVVAARAVGPDGSVTVFEPAVEKISLTKETVALNDINTVTVEPVAVGTPLRVWGLERSDDTLDPSALPVCDVLELDCEGAELEILESLHIRPAAIIVETHGVTDPTENRITERLGELGYDIVGVDTENADCGCYIVTAEKNTANGGE